MERLTILLTPLSHEAMKCAESKTKKPSESKCKGKKIIDARKMKKQKKKKENEELQKGGYHYLAAHPSTNTKTRILHLKTP